MWVKRQVSCRSLRVLWPSVGAQTAEDAMRAYEPVEAVRIAASSHLSSSPYSYRKVSQRPTLRELIAPFGSTGYMLLFDIRTPELILVIGVRHQREDDFH